MKRIFAIILLIPHLVSAQAVDKLIFREKIHEFGDIVEANGKVDHRFVFTNNSGRPVQILNVVAACGCTTPDWTKAPVPAGKTGYIDVIFDPKGRPGYFNKALSVATNSEELPIILQLKGQVVEYLPGMKNDFTEAMGKLFFKSRAFNMGTVYNNQEPTVKHFLVKNGGEKAISFQSVEKPAYMKIKMPTTIMPGAKDTITVTYDGRMKNTFGFTSDNLLFTTNDTDAEKKSISVFATLEEFYAPLSPEELQKAPQAVLKESSIDLGLTPPGSTLERKFSVTNKGKKELKIKSLQGNCICITADTERKSIKPGDSTVVRIVFKPQNRAGTQQKAIAIYTNDPRNPVQWLTVQVNVQD